MRSELEGVNELRWIHVSEPEPEELASFVREAELLPTDAEFIVQNHQRPEVTVRDDYLIILINVPTFNKQTRVTRGAPLYVIVREKAVWTVTPEPIVVLTKLWEDFSSSSDKRNEYFSDGALGLALHVIGAMYSSAFRKLERLAKHIDIAEDAVFQGNERKMVEEISALIRDVMDFRKVMRLQTHLFVSVPHHPLFTPVLRAQWQRLDGQTQRLWSMLESLLESTKQLAATNTSLLQHKENELLRMLTLYSIISIPILFLIQPLDLGWPWLASAGYGVGFGFLVIFLVYVFVRARRRRVL